MKRFLILISLFVLMLMGIPFKLTAQQMTKQDYLEKSRDQKKSAWVLLGGGAVLLGAGFIVSMSNTGDALVGMLSGKDYNGSNTNGNILTVVGGAAMLGSIPLFISSKSNSEKAILLSLQNKPLTMPRPYARLPKSYPSLSLKIPLN
ncbi:hypothetical protein [Algoriphagus sp. CAU 1675]|uniref:hypothetical protein n=1 Tax=Algoriphagus sp. CAU 1675 TaxID=3032597 RepID=UPI0023DCC39D|nr:hypothetical protein [Algoriphagus sp. CAU 1675]MDF2157786.1 hypothetical protein [Algoriphagus sp. CAU 1675]